jgi:hypothetical protein
MLHNLCLTDNILEDVDHNKVIATAGKLLSILTSDAEG